MLDFKRKSRELEKNFADEVKNFHNVDLLGGFGDWTGQLEGNLMGQKSGVNRECQMLRLHLLAFRK
jgi:hypothetical protein